jgi:uncharacterized membrane protein YbhN (UPF0104 family)
MSTQAKRLIKLLLRLLVAGALLVWVFSEVDLTQFRRTIGAAQWTYLLGVWLSTALFFWVQSIALRLILRKQDCTVSTHTLFGASSITALYSLVLPGLLSTGVKWYILKRHTGKGSNVLSSMLYNQMTLTVVMAVIGLLGLIVTNPTRILWPDAGRQGALPLTCGIALVSLVVSCVLVLNHRTGGIVRRTLAILLRPLPRTLREKSDEVLGQIEVFQTAGWRFHLTVAFINVVDGLAIGLLIYLCAARAAYVTVPLSVLIWLCAIVFVLGKVPISVANLGVREVTLVVLLAGYGVGRSEALLMSMILFSSLIFMAALGAAYQLFWSGARGAEAGRGEPAIAAPPCVPGADDSEESR